MIKIQILPVTLLSLLFASCGGGGSGSDPTNTINEDSNTNNPVVDTPPDDQSANDIPGGTIDPGEINKDNHFLGPRYGEELTIHHATLVMDVLRLISFYKGYFVGLEIGETTYTSSEFLDYYGEIEPEILNGGLVPCYRHTDEPWGSKAVTWSNIDGDYPKQYTSTRKYYDCNQDDIHFGAFDIYNGTVNQSGTATYVGALPAIANGSIYADQFEISSDSEDISLTIDGYMNYDAYTNGRRSTDISEIGMRFREDNYTIKSDGRYIEDIHVHDGTISFDIVTPEGQEGSSNTYAIEHANLKMDIENNNHEKIALSVKTIQPPSDEFLYSLEISRAELPADDPAPMHHTIRIDRINQPELQTFAFNVSIDFNKNGIIEKDNVYPDEYYEEENLLSSRWGFISGL
ncbi:MAG: hypothetical protein ABW098_12845 [Candidatus Thiodiazotropha sp.]